eukprot:1156503-Pelagomonas_calceolata.AAC.4
MPSSPSSQHKGVGIQSKILLVYRHGWRDGQPGLRLHTLCACQAVPVHKGVGIQSKTLLVYRLAGGMGSLVYGCTRYVHAKQSQFTTQGSGNTK